MGQKLTGNEIAKIYSEAMNFRLFHRFLFFLGSIAVGFWFLCPLFFGDDYPNWVSYVVFPPVVIWVAVALPKHFVVIDKDDRLRKIYYNPFLFYYIPFISTKCALAAIKPTAEDSNKHPWVLILYYFSLFAPIVCFLILLAFFVVPVIFQSVG